MEHFKYFPKIEYSKTLSVNLLVRGIIKDKIKNNNVLYYKYKVRDGERPDILSSKYYGNSKYSWILFYANDIFDPRFDWPMSNSDFNAFIVSKYGSVEKAQNLLGTPHHYEMYRPYTEQRIKERPSGNIDGGNTQFALSDNPQRNRELITINGVLKDRNIDYDVITGVVSVLDFKSAPEPGDVIVADYVTNTRFYTEATVIIDKKTFEDPNILAEEKRAVSNYDYEFNLNEEKSDIIVIDETYVSQIEDELRVLFKNKK